MRSFFRNNGLSIVFLILFILAFIGQWLTGFSEYNKERMEDGKAGVSLGQYSQSGHFLQATFENWESEFLQIFDFYNSLNMLLTLEMLQD